MKTYNKALDYAALAIASYRNGDEARAAKLFMKAATASDASRAVAVIEASNAQAFEAAKKAKKVNAEFEVNTDEIDDLIDDEGEEVDASEDEDESVDDPQFDQEFAAVLSSMHKKKKK